jgi:hypothetical protein
MIYVSKIGAVQECSIAMFVSLKLDDAGCLLLDLATVFSKENASTWGALPGYYVAIVI